jgi:single-stranded-DNA-specific exonuclease
MARTQNPGLQALMQVAGVKTVPDTYTCGFVMGPRINAGGRIHKADLGARLLTTDDAEEAKNIAWTLNDCNDKRKDMQAEMMDQAMRMVMDQGLDQHPAILVGDESWHPGLNGLVAGRLVEKYKKPAAVIAYAPGHDNPLEGRGSGRSVVGVNIAAAFIDARLQDLIIKGGGHAMAAGFTLLPGQVPAFRDFFLDHIAKQAAGQVIVNDTSVDGILSVRGATLDLMKILQSIAPFGQNNAEPVFVLPQVKVISADRIGTDHVRLLISDSDGGGRMKAVAFRVAETPLGQTLLGASGRILHLLGRLKLNEWQGRESVELHIEDAAQAG